MLTSNPVALLGPVTAFPFSFSQGSLDCVLSKLQTAKLSWEKEATLTHLEYKDQLKEFGLNPLEI